MPDLIYNKEEILKLIEAQKNNPTFDTENRGVTFLYGLANDRIGLTDDAKEFVPEYFDILRHSKHPEIKRFLDDAQKKFEAENTQELNVDLNTPIATAELVSQEELNAPIVSQADLNEPEVEIIQNELSPEEQRFESLKDKDSLELSSEEYFFLADLLTQKLNDAEPNSDELRLVQRQFIVLLNMARHKIDQVFEGEIPSDEKFPGMVRRFGNDQQREILDERTQELLNSGYQSVVDEAIVTSLHTQQDIDIVEDDVIELEASANQETAKIEDDVIELEASANQETAKIEDDVIELEASANQETAKIEDDVIELEASANQETAKIEDDVIELEASANKETAKIEDDVVELEASTVLSDVTTAEPIIEAPVISKPKPHEKAPKNSSAAPKAKNGELPLDAIVYNSKRLAALNAQELLDIAKRIDEVPNEKQKRRMKSAFRYFIVQKLDNQRKVNLAEDGLDVLAQDFGTTKQRAMFSDNAPQPAAVVTETIEPSEPIIVILPPEHEEIVENHAEPKSEKKPEVKKQPEKEKVIITKSPWYKRASAKVVFAATIFLGSVTVLAAGIAKVFGSDKAPDKDNAPKTETVTKNTKSTTNEAKTIHFDQARAEQKKAEAQQKAKETIQAKKAEQAKQTVQTSQETKLSKEDSQYATRTADFAQRISKMYDMSVNDVKEKISDFAESVDLPQNVSQHRMEYLASFYSLFPNSEFGSKMSKMLHGEKVDVSKDEISQLSKDHGQFGKKDIKTMKTLQVMKQVKSNVK